MINLENGGKPLGAVDEKVKYKTVSVGGVKVRKRVGGRPDPKKSRRAKQNFKKNKAKILMALRKGQKKARVKISKIRKGLAKSRRREDLSSIDRRAVDHVLAYMEAGGSFENALNILQHGEIVVEDRESFGDALVLTLDDLELGESFEDIDFNGPVAIISFGEDVDEEDREAFEQAVESASMQWVTPKKVKVVIPGINFEEDGSLVLEVDEMDEPTPTPDADDDREDPTDDPDDDSKTGTKGPATSTDSE